MALGSGVEGVEHDVARRQVFSLDLGPLAVAADMGVRTDAFQALGGFGGGEALTLALQVVKHLIGGQGVRSADAERRAER